MRIVVTGREGQVARSLVERAAQHPTLKVIAIGRPDLDLIEPAKARRAIVAADPDIVVSAAAYTGVDAAEDEPELVQAINETGARAVAEAARACGVPVIHLSTDYVFSGEFEGAYREDMTATPNTVYGKSKLSGEWAVRDANPDFVILRTGWVYSPFGRNFVKTMLKLAGERDVISVVDDQIGNPTCALDIADAVIDLAHNFHAGDTRAGTYHYVGRGEATWYGFARQVLSESAARSGPFATVRPISSADFTTRAVRPRNSRLDTSKIIQQFGIQPKDWRMSVAAVVGRLVGGSVELAAVR